MMKLLGIICNCRLIDSTADICYNFNNIGLRESQTRHIMQKTAGGYGLKIQDRLWALKAACTKENIRRTLKGWARFLLNPRLLLCLAIAWMITNGWSYILFGIGMALKINWMRMVGGAYMSLLWLPFTPEKLLTVLIAIGLLRLFYPRDRHTLGTLRAKLSALRKKSRKADA